MFKELGRFTASQPWVVCAAWLGAALVLSALAPPWQAAVPDELHSLPEACPSVQGQRLFERAFPAAAIVNRPATTPVAFEPFGVTSVALVFAVLLLAWRAPLLSLLVLCAAIVSIWMSCGLIAFASKIPGIQLMAESHVLALALCLGGNAAWSALLINRYREELAKGMEVGHALRASLDALGRVVFASAATMICSLSLAVFCEFRLLHDTGLVLAGVVAVTLLCALTLVPALLRIVGRAAFWPRPAPAAERSNLSRRLNFDSLGFWDALSHRIAKRPVVIGLLALLPLLPCGTLGVRGRALCGSTGERNGAVTVLISTRGDWRGREGMLELEQLSKGFGALPHIVAVHSYTQPRGSAEDYLAVVDGHNVARFDILLNTAAHTAAAAQTLADITTWVKNELPTTTLLPGGMHAECCGPTTASRDVLQLTRRDTTRHMQFATAAALLIAVIVLRSLTLAGAVVACGFLAYFTALGMGTVPPALDWRIPFFMLVLVLGGGAASGALVLVTSLEEKNRYGLRDALRRGLGRVGASMALQSTLLAAAVIALIATGNKFLVQLGLSAAAAILLFGWIVAPFVLMPVATLLAGKSPRLTRTAKKKRATRRTAVRIPYLSDDPEADELYGWLLETTPRQSAS